MREKADILYCSCCECDVIEDIPGWYACYCASREIDGPEEYPDTWSDPLELDDPREEALTAAERNKGLLRIITWQNFLLVQQIWQDG